MARPASNRRRRHPVFEADKGLAGIGDRAAHTAVHERFGDALKYSCAVGATYWEQPAKTDAAGKKTPGPKPVVFLRLAKSSSARRGTLISLR
jgi:hypothetical protein